MPADFPGPIDPETAAFNAQIEVMLDPLPRVYEVPVAEAREAREQGRSVWGPLVLSDRAVTREVPGPGGPIPVRVLAPQAPRAVYLHIHGGGWVLGGSHHQDPRLELMRDRCRVAVVSVEYRLSPEHPYPAAPDDCEAVAAWLVENSADEFGTNRLLIGGESAGAHLSAVTLLRTRRRYRASPFLGANLVYGVFDLGLTPSARMWGDRILVLNTPTIRWFAEQFLAGADPEDPDVSPLLADLGGMPPALFTVGTEDPLLDDSLFMHQRWRAAGGSSELAVFPGGAHGFDAFPIGLAEEALSGMHRFVNRLLDA
jgi:acetyl esterase/lipase